MLVDDFTKKGFFKHLHNKDGSRALVMYEEMGGFLICCIKSRWWRLESSSYSANSMMPVVGSAPPTCHFTH